MQGRLEGVCLGTLQGEPGLKSSVQCTRSAGAVQGRPLIPHDTILHVLDKMRFEFVAVQKMWSTIPG